MAEPSPTYFTLPTSATAAREKRLVALSSLLAAVLLTALKVVVGTWTNSLGIISEAAHSALDLVAAALTLWAVKMSAQPPDAEHTYGHGKFESLTALVETALLLVTCGWIIYEACRRLFFAAEVEVVLNVWAFAVVLLSIVIDFSRSRALRRAAVKYGSQALEADALHFSTDVWSSSVVLLGLVGVWAAKKLHLPWLALADSVAALVVAMLVIAVSLRLGRRSLADLLDSVPGGLRERVIAATTAVPGVEKVQQVRMRRAGPEVFVDIVLAVNRTVAFERAHEIANAVQQEVRKLLATAEVLVHVEPVVNDSEDLSATVHVIAARHDLRAHAVRVYEEQGCPAVDLHLEVSPALSLEDAHDHVSDFERELREATPGLGRIVTHIEPASEAVAVPIAVVSPVGVERAIREFLDAAHIRAAVHDIHVQEMRNELAVSLHMTLAAETPITVAHDLASRLEQHLRTRIARLSRVVVHIEPK